MSGIFKKKKGKEINSLIQIFEITVLKFCPNLFFFTYCDKSMNHAFSGLSLDKEISVFSNLSLDNVCWIVFLVFFLELTLK